MAEALSRRRPACGRGRVDALSRLFARRRRMGTEHLRRARESRIDRVPETPESRSRAHARRARRDHDRRRIDGMARRDRTRRTRRPRFQLQVEHGLDARHAALHARRCGLSPLPPSQHDVRDGVRVFGALRAAAFARRSGARQGLAARQDAGRPLAALREPARVFRFHVDASRQKAAVHGRRIRPDGRVRSRPVAALASARRSTASRRAEARARPEPPVRQRARAACARQRARGLRMADRRRCGEQRVCIQARRRRGTRSGRGQQFHAGAAARLSHRHAARRPLERSAQHRRQRVWRVQPWQRRADPYGRSAESRQTAIGVCRTHYPTGCRRARPIRSAPAGTVSA